MGVPRNTSVNRRRVGWVVCVSQGLSQMMVMCPGYAAFKKPQHVTR